MSFADAERTWIDLEVRCEMARLEIVLDVARLLDRPVLASPRIYNWETDGDGRD